ncbi:MAG TPA: hypothetical protein ENJ20_01285 [Bacteroidetes bacterium]|nr:hypothetical protein [Bacteroidota bacterium]
MFKHILANAADINWMAIFALLTFFFLFVIVVVTVFFRNKQHFDKMSRLPLDDSLSINSETTNGHEK